MNLNHPERSTDVVLLLDTFTDVPGQDQQSSLATAVRGANGIADHYLRRRDRVGLIAFGGSIRWLVPGARYRLLGAELAGEPGLLSNAALKWAAISFVGSARL